MTENGFYTFTDRNRLNLFYSHIVATQSLNLEKIKKLAGLSMVFFEGLSQDEFEQLKAVAELFQGIYGPEINHTTAQARTIEDVEDGLGAGANPESTKKIDYVQNPPPDFMDDKFVHDYDISDPEIRKVVIFLLGVLAAIGLLLFAYSRYKP